MKPVLIRASPLLMFVGTGLTAWGLFAPVVRFPLIGSISCSQPDFGGGPGLPCTVMVLLAVASLLLISKPRLRPLGGWCGGGALGLLAGALFIRQRWVFDQLQQLSDASGQMDGGIQTMLAKVEPGAGLYALAAGLILWLIGSLTRIICWSQ